MLLILYNKTFFLIKLQEIQTPEKVLYSTAIIPKDNINNGIFSFEELDWKENTDKDKFIINDRPIPFRFCKKHTADEEPSIRFCYDYYYGGIESSLFPEKPAYIAVVLSENLQDSAEIDIMRLRFKTWEDGLGNQLAPPY